MSLFVRTCLPGAVFISPSGVWVWLWLMSLMKVKGGVGGGGLGRARCADWCSRYSCYQFTDYFLHSWIKFGEKSNPRMAVKCIFPVLLWNRLLLLILAAWHRMEKLLGQSLKFHHLQIFTNTHTCAKYHLVHVGIKASLCTSNLPTWLHFQLLCKTWTLIEHCRVLSAFWQFISINSTCSPQSSILSKPIKPPIKLKPQFCLSRCC